MGGILTSKGLTFIGWRRSLIQRSVSRYRHHIPILIDRRTFPFSGKVGTPETGEAVLSSFRFASIMYPVSSLHQSLQSCANESTDSFPTHTSNFLSVHELIHGSRSNASHFFFSSYPHHGLAALKTGVDAQSVGSRTSRTDGTDCVAQKACVWPPEANSQR